MLKQFIKENKEKVAFNITSAVIGLTIGLYFILTSGHILWLSWFLPYIFLGILALPLTIGFYGWKDKKNKHE
jgi:hypothetical protein